jgi:hypothetical protein
MKRILLAVSGALVAFAATLTMVSLASASLSGSAGGTHLDRADAAAANKVKCHVEDHIQKFPTKSSPGTVFSFVRCPAPFGHGIQHSTFTLTPKTSTTGRAVLRFKAYFDTGTVSGVWRATYRYKDAKTAVFKQKVQWTKGTGAFTHVRATGRGLGVQHGFLGEINQVLTITGT